MADLHLISGAVRLSTNLECACSFFIDLLAKQKSSYEQALGSVVLPYCDSESRNSYFCVKFGIRYYLIS